MVDERDLFWACESLIRALRVFPVVRKQIVVLFIAWDYCNTIYNMCQAKCCYRS